MMPFDKDDEFELFYDFSRAYRDLPQKPMITANGEMNDGGEEVKGGEELVAAAGEGDESDDWEDVDCEDLEDAGEDEEDKMEEVKEVNSDEE